ncbi:hypothetical protein G6M26_26980 [Agrobacterium tumefaciens]|nr:hypothetical protein [Agrobacterium tumefaciens]NTE22199.1 hypothetical protein [Agrobacterium tumefaciens]
MHELVRVYTEIYTLMMPKMGNIAFSAHLSRADQRSKDYAGTRLSILAMLDPFLYSKNMPAGKQKKIRRIPEQYSG